MKRKRGFTLVELLVVIAVIALLLSILMPVLRMAKDGANRILCANHIKNLMLSMTMYADTHNNKFPQTTGNWPWDCQKSIVTELLKNMGVDVAAIKTYPNIPKEFSTNFYCPTNAEQKRYRESVWNYSSGYSVLGYAFLWKAGWNTNLTTGATTMVILGKDGKTDPSKKWVDRTDMAQASEAELIVDAELSLQVADKLKYPFGNFGPINTGTTPTGSADYASHWITDAKIAGGNIGFADGHVEWRTFTEMPHRITINIAVGALWWWW